MDVHRALIHIDIMPPDTIEKLGTGKHTTGRGHEKFQQAEFGRPETDFAALAMDAVRLTVELDIAAFQHRGQNLRLGAAQHRLDACHQFRRRERLHDIVVRTRRQAANPFAFLTARRQHDDRQTFGFRTHAQATAKLDA